MCTQIIAAGIKSDFEWGLGCLPHRFTVDEKGHFSQVIRSSGLQAESALDLCVAEIVETNHFRNPQAQAFILSLSQAGQADPRPKGE